MYNTHKINLQANLYRSTLHNKYFNYITKFSNHSYIQKATIIYDWIVLTLLTQYFIPTIRYSKYKNKLTPNKIHLHFSSTKKYIQRTLINQRHIQITYKKQFNKMISLSMESFQNTACLQKKVAKKVAKKKSSKIFIRLGKK